MANVIAFQLYIDGVWTTYEAFTEEGWNYKVGPSLNGGIDPSTMSFAWKSLDLSMDPSNPLGALYGKIGRNTSTRMLVNGTVVAVGEASSWKPQRSIDHRVSPARGRAWTDFTADGPLRRLGRWDDNLRSPMNRQISSYGSSLRGLWMLEDSARAQNLANQVSGGQPGQFSGSVTLDGDDGAGGTSGAVVLGSDGRIGGTFLNTPTYNGYQISFMFKLDQVPASSTYIALFQWYDSQGKTWYWRINNTGFEIAWLLPDGTTGDIASVSHGIDPTQWIRCRCKVTIPVVGTLQYEPAWMQQDGGVVGFTDSATGQGGQTGTVLRWESVANTYSDGGAFNSVFLTSDTALDILNTYDSQAAFSGYLGETAGARFSRLMREVGVDPNWSGLQNLSPIMGRQNSSSIMELLQEIATTDGGLIYDEVGTISGRPRVFFRMNNSMLNQTPVLALTYGTNVAPPFDKIIDDQRLANDITGKNWDGTEVRVEDSASVMGTQAPPAGVGRYTASLDVSMRWPSGVSDRVGWELANNTLNRPRYASVSINLTNAASSSLLASVNAVRPGDLITVAGVEAQVIPMIVINIERAGGPVLDTVKLNCLPGELYETGTYDDAVHRYDSHSTTLNGAITNSTTSVPVTSADPMDKWDTSYTGSVWIGPERCTVSAITAGSASGTAWNQTMTLVRGANGVAIAHASGEAVTVNQPAIYSMNIRTMP